MTTALQKLDIKRIFFILLGLALFFIVYYSPAWPDAIDPLGKHFVLTKEGKGALAVFLLASTWWIFEVVPIGVTGIMIGVMQTMFLIRTAEQAFKDFMDPSVLFILASVVIGMVFTKTGLTRRMAYKMLVIVGEKTSMIMLGCFVVTGALTLIMAHTAVAATIYPLLLSIYALYSEDGETSNFGKALFIGMAYVAGAGSVMTLLGAARGAVAIGFFKDMCGREIGFFELSYYMVPIGLLMIALLWGFFMIVLKPEKKTIPGLREKAKRLSEELGPLTRNEKLASVIIFSCIVVLALRSFVPFLKPIDKTAIILVSTILFFISNILTIEDLEEIPWNIILLFAGAMSIGFCLWKTEAANWLAVNWLVMFQSAPAFIFIMSIAFFVMIMTNFIMNVAAIAISLPVALVIAPYLHVAPEVILYASLVTAGMPFMLLIGAAPNAIAYNSKMFTPGEFLKYGVIASILLMIVVAFAVKILWPLMGMPVIMN